MGSIACCAREDEISRDVEEIVCVDGRALQNCRGPVSVRVPDGVTSIADRAFCDCRMLVSVSLPASLTCIGEGAFRGCDLLRAVSLPEAVSALGSGAFLGCYSMSFANLPADLAAIEDNVFSGCKQLAFVKLPSCLQSIGSWAFFGCASLADVDLPRSVTWIGTCAFYSCSSIGTLRIPRAVTAIQPGTFAYCSSVTDVLIPSSVVSIGSWAFRDCCSLASVQIPDSVESIGYHAFAWCGRLGSVELPPSVTTIGRGAFTACVSLRQVGIPESVTTIGDGAFVWCAALAHVHIPGSVRSIGDDAFFGCGPALAVSLPGHVAHVGKRAFPPDVSITVRAGRGSVSPRPLDSRELVVRAVAHLEEEHAPRGDEPVGPGSALVLRAAKDGRASLGDKRLASGDECPAIECGCLALEGGRASLGDKRLASGDECPAIECGCLALEDGCLALEDGCLALEDGCLAVEDGCLAVEDGCLAIEAAPRGGKCHCDRGARSPGALPAGGPRSGQQAPQQLDCGERAQQPVEEPLSLPAGGSSDGEAVDAEDLRSLRDVFRACDANGDGTINLRELIKACRRRPEVAAFFGLPSEIHQEGASRKAVMEFFQGADRNDDREITWEELRQFYRERRPVGVSPQRSSTPGGGGGRRDAEGSPPHAQPRPPPQGALPPPLRPPAAEAADAPALEDGGPQGSGGSRPPSEGPRAGGAAAYPVSEEGAATSARDSRQTASAALAAAAPALAPPRRAWRPAGGSAELYQQRQPRSGGGGPLPSRQASPWPGAAGGGLDAGRQRREPLRGDLVSHRGAACLLLEIRTSGAANEKPYAVLQTVDGRVRVETDLSKLSLMAETFSPTAEDAEFKVGSKVMVQRPKGFPWKCSVIGIEGDYLRIHYQGFPDDFDEWLPKASWRITRAAARTTGPHAAGPRRRPRSASSGGERTQLRRAEARLQTACEELEWSRAACLAAEEAVREAQADVERQLHASVRGARQRLARAEQGARSCLRHTGVALPRRCHASPPAALRGRAPLGAGHAAAGASAYELLQMLNASPGYDAMHPVAWAADMWPPIRPG